MGPPASMVLGCWDSRGAQEVSFPKASGFWVEKEDSMRTPQLPSHHDCLALQCPFFYLLDKQVSLIFWSPPVLSPDDTRGPVQVEHVYQVLLLILQLLNLRLQLGIHTLQLLRLLQDKRQRHEEGSHLGAHQAGGHLQGNRVPSASEGACGPGEAFGGALEMPPRRL